MNGLVTTQSFCCLSSSRALSGLSGDLNAKIFAAKFNAELVAVGDVFTTCDQVDACHYCNLHAVVVPLFMELTIRLLFGMIV